MHIKTKLITILLAASLLSPTMVSAKGRGNNNTQKQASQITAEDEANLLWMREEEKLARDVYLTLYKKWGAAIFSNIAKSEQQHMDAILRKIELYGLVDPVIPKVGEFDNVDIQILYDELVAKGKKSYMNALEVGATIEDLDILDLMLSIEETNNLALQTTYASLLEGSKNHLRAFVGQLGEYEPVYIEQDFYTAIITY